MGQRFEETIRETKAVVLAAIRRHLRSEYYSSIDDVVQEVYIRAYRSLSGGKFRGDSSLRTYLYTIARNESLRMNQKLDRDATRRVEMEHIENVAYRDREDERRSVEMNLEIVQSVLKKIPEKYRSVMMLYSQGLAEKEISSHLNIKQGTVKSRISRGKVIMRKAIQSLEVGTL